MAARMGLLFGMRGGGRGRSVGGSKGGVVDFGVRGGKARGALLELVEGEAGWEEDEGGDCGIVTAPVQASRRWMNVARPVLYESSSLTARFRFRLLLSLTSPSASGFSNRYGSSSLPSTRSPSPSPSCDMPCASRLGLGQRLLSLSLSRHFVSIPGLLRFGGGACGSSG